MAITLNKEAYKKLISEDIERLEKDMKQCPERDHIKTVLIASIATYYVPEPKIEKCPKCKSKNIDSINPMDWMCDDCGYHFIQN